MLAVLLIGSALVPSLLGYLVYRVIDHRKHAQRLYLLDHPQWREQGRKTL